MNTMTEIGDVNAILAETPEKFQRILPKENTVRVRNLIKRYEMGTQTVDALRGVNFQIQRGEYISIMGPSGSGKSTLFNMIGGLDKPTEGRVYIDEVDIAQLDAYELAWLRCRKIGYIFQSFNLIPCYDGTRKRFTSDDLRRYERGRESRERR